MSKKKLNLHKIFALEEPEIKEEMPNRTVERTNVTSNERIIEDPNVITNDVSMQETFTRDNVDTNQETDVLTYEVPNDRTSTRESFEIYKDQQDALDQLIRHRWSIEKRRPIKSQMIRDALDTYLAKEFEKLTA